MLIKSIIALCLGLGQGFFCYAQLDSYAIDYKNSQITFSIKHLGVLEVDGVFEDFEGVLVFKNKTLLAIRASINVQSITTHDASRDKMLISEAYFNTDVYPNIQFEATNIDMASNQIIGNLTIKNVTKSVVLSVQISEINKDMKLTTKLSRKNFKLKFGSMNSLIGDAVDIDVFIRY